jgi:hypothetical protein
MLWLCGDVLFLLFDRSVSGAGLLQQLSGISGKKITSSLWPDNKDECSGNDQCYS